VLPFDRIAAIKRHCSWAGDFSNFPREVTETALAHVIGDKAEQAYRRSDTLEKWEGKLRPQMSGSGRCCRKSLFWLTNEGYLRSGHQSQHALRANKDT
jgi:hypothetical protein